MDPELLKDLNELNKSLHSTNLSIKNRLLSIFKDSKYVNKIHNEYYKDLPIIPNERCGKWYLSNYETTSYFKSTDGHTNNWSFSTRRLNLHLLKIIRENNGLIIVDSTRRGKIMPDSFSKTIPIWIGILNKFIQPNKEFNELFFTPDKIVSKYEHDRILELMPNFLENLSKFKDLINDIIIDKDDNRILKPFWIYPGCKKIPIFTGLENYLPVILISASEISQDGENKMFGFSYVQGAGDDHELWSCGLTPSLFWDNIDKFYGLKNLNNGGCYDDNDDEKVRELVREIVEGNKNKIKDCGIKHLDYKFWNDDEIVKINGLLYFGKIDQNINLKESEFKNKEFDKIIILDSTFKLVKDLEDSHLLYQFDIDSKCKKSSKLLRKLLPDIMKVISINEKILIVCNSGDDLSVGVALCCLNVNKKNIDKESLRRDLIMLTELKKINPQRATLNSVNFYLMK